MKNTAKQSLTIALSPDAFEALHERARAASELAGVEVRPRLYAAGLLHTALGFRPDGSARPEAAAPEQVSHTPEPPRAAPPEDIAPAPRRPDQGPAKRTRPRPIARTSGADMARPTRTPKLAPKSKKGGA
jgi:hypothetical protein